MSNVMNYDGFEKVSLKEFMRYADLVSEAVWGVQINENV